MTIENCAAVLDFETTGLDASSGQVIEGAVALVELDADGRFGRTLDSYSSFNDPLAPIPPEIVKLTGITQEMVTGQKLDWSRFNAVLARARILISHNAPFDRAWLEQHGGYRGPLWGCSIRHIDWSETHGMPCRTLKHLAWEHDHFPNAHRAIDDVNTLVFLLRQTSKADATRTYGQELLERAAVKRHLVLANFSPFETKDLLKERGFRWAPEKKVWWKLVAESELAEMDRFMTEAIYKGKPRHFVSEPVDALDPGFKGKFGL